MLCKPHINYRQIPSFLNAFMSTSPMIFVQNKIWSLLVLGQLKIFSLLNEDFSSKSGFFPTHTLAQKQTFTILWRASRKLKGTSNYFQEQSFSEQDSSKRACIAGHTTFLSFIRNIASVMIISVPYATTLFHLQFLQSHNDTGSTVPAAVLPGSLQCLCQLGAAISRRTWRWGKE